MDMNTDDLKLLGFHLVEKDPITTRGSKLGGTRDDANSRSSWLVSSELNSPKSGVLTPEEGGPNLVFNAESNVEARLDQMNQAYKKVQEQRMKAVFARMPPEQLKELQLAKLFKLA